MAGRYTTPTLRLRVIGADLRGCDVIVTLRQGSAVVDLTDFDLIDSDGSDTYIDVTLSQRQTARFREGKPIEIQVNFLDYNGFRGTTDIGTRKFHRNIHWKEMRRG